MLMVLISFYGMVVCKVCKICSEKFLEYHKDFVEKTRKKYGFYEVFNLKNLYNRKNIQVGFLANKIQKWEVKALKKNIHPFLKEYNKLISECIIEDYIPAVEKLYKEKIIDYIIFKPKFYDDYIYSFSVKIFNNPKFKDVDSHQGVIEEKISNYLSKYIKDINGRGPEKVFSTIVGERYLVTVMQGILCPLFKRVDFSDIKENIPIDKMMQEVISCAII